MKQFILSSLFFVLSLNLSAQIAPDNPLFIELQKLDSLFFERGFNQCDLAYLETRVASQLNFYHDEIGLQDRAGFFENMKTNICGNPDLKPIRKLEPNSLAVFPLYDNGELYAAVLKGIHHFYIREKGKEDKWTSTAKFNMVWKKENNTWKLAEVLSYDHQDQTFNPASAKRPDLETLLKNAKIPALGLGIIKNGKLSKVEVLGTLDQQRIAPYNTIFKVASLTKPIFAITVLKLIDSQQLDLDEPLYKYWIDPDLKQDKRHQKLSPRLVLTHQTGLPNWRYLTDDNKLSFQFEPGTKYQYSGEGFEYLRKAIEKKLGKPIEEIAQELIFDRVGMPDTRFWWDEAMDSTRYAQNFDDKGNKIPTHKYFEANAAANLLSTVEDYGKFLAYVINGAELSQDLYREMLKQQVQLGDHNYFGLGWQILSDFSNDEFALVHSGKDPGVSTLAVLFPKSKNGFLIFMNGDNVLPIYEELLKHRLYLGKDLWDKQ